MSRAQRNNEAGYNRGTASTDEENTAASMLIGEVKRHIMWRHKDHMAYLELRGDVMAWAMDRRMESREGKEDSDGYVNMGMVGDDSRARENTSSEEEWDEERSTCSTKNGGRATGGKGM